MSQEDVLDVLEGNRGTWLSVNEVKDVLKLKGKTNGVLQGVSDDIFKLTAYGYVEMRGIGGWKHHKVFRIR